MAEKSNIITIERSSLLPALGQAQKAVARRNTIPILANLLATIEDGHLALIGTDLDVEIKAVVACAAAAAFDLTVPAQILYDAVRKLPEGAEIRIEADAQKAKVSAGRTRFTVPVLPASDFPRIAAGDLPHNFDLAAGDLARLIDTTRFAISTEETRYYLNGIYLHVDDASQTLFGVATDGHRLACIGLNAPEGALGMPAIILPRRAVDLLKDFAGDKGTVRIGVSDTKIRFALIGENGSETLAMTSKLIDATYPDYRRVVPAQHPNCFTLRRETLAHAIDRVVTISAGAKGSAVKFNFSPEALKLSTVNPDLGSAEDEVSVEAGKGDAVEIGFNGRYCLDMLGACTAEQLIFYIGGPGDPALVKPEGDETVTFVLMPMRV